MQSRLLAHQQHRLQIEALQHRQRHDGGRTVPGQAHQRARAPQRVVQRSLLQPGQRRRQLPQLQEQEELCNALQLQTAKGSWTVCQALKATRMKGGLGAAQRGVEGQGYKTRFLPAQV